MSKKIVSVAVITLLFISVLMLKSNIRAHALENGVYLFMTPPMHVAEETGELFDVAINISGVENLQNAEFTITYNTSLLDVAQVVQGSFFPPPPKSYFKWEDNESSGTIKVNMSLANSETPRNSNGTLVLISFEVVQGPESCVSSPISLQNALLLDSASVPIIHDSVSAVYFWKSMQPDPPMEGRALDIYTHEGGIGPDEPGGQFMTGELVDLISRVTYNNDPVQQKLVAFAVRNPLNESVVFRTAVTDKDGFAAISFRTPCLLSSNGTWTAISIVDIAGKVVWDTISFQVYFKVPVGGYSFPIEECTTEKPSAIHLLLLTILTAVFTVVKRKKPKELGRHGCVCAIFTLLMLAPLVRVNASLQTSEAGNVQITNFYSCDALGIQQDYFPKKTTAYFNVSVRNLAQDPKNISIYLTVQDELNVPIGTAQLNATISQNVSAYYIMSVFLPKWAYVGLATAYASLLEEGSLVDTKTTEFYIGPEDLTPPVIHILSPENATCVTRPVSLVFTIDERATWIGYSLNGLENVTIGGNTTLAGLGKGSYRIMVYANDTSGNVGSSEEIFFIVLNQPPLAFFTESATIVPTSTPITFNASSSYDPDGSIVAYVWDFGDGNSGSSVIVGHSYIDDGVYNVTLTVTDNDGASSVTSALKTILDRPPVANFSETAETVYVDELINFNASTSYDPDGTIVAYFWDFGDGTNATGVTVDHGYEHNGTYTITLSVTDDDGMSASTSTIKNVLNRPDIAVSNVTSSKTVLGQGYSLEINVTVTNRGDRLEAFDVTIYAGATSIATQAITLTTGNSVTITFNWNTTGFAKGNYTIKAVADTVQGETETDNNTFTDGKVLVSVPGDVDGDRVVDIDDLLILSEAFWGTPGAPNWNPNADIDDNHKVDLDDLILLIDHFWEYW